MSHAELIRRLQTLPAAQQAEVYEFVEFLASRQAATQPAAGASATLSQTPLAAWLDKPFVVCYDPRKFRVIAPAYLSANKAVCPTAI